MPIDLSFHKKCPDLHYLITHSFADTLSLPTPPILSRYWRKNPLAPYLALHGTKAPCDLLAFTRPDDPPGAVECLKGICEAVYVVPIRRSRLRDAQSLAASLLGGKSFVIERDFYPEMAQKVDQLMAAEAFDAVHADQLWMAQYAIRANSRRPGLRLVLDEHNACFQIFQRLAESERNPLKRLIYQREARVLHQFETWACLQFDWVVTVTQEDRAILSGMGSKASTKKWDDVFTTIPICVDTQEFQPVTL
jgi:polysaccharide biosynthesis protein PslH